MLTSIPGTTAMDVGGVKTAGFKGVWTTDGRGDRVHVDSLHTMRRVEREADAWLWRAWSDGEWSEWEEDCGCMLAPASLALAARLVPIALADGDPGSRGGL